MKVIDLARVISSYQPVIVKTLFNEEIIFDSISNSLCGRADIVDKKIKMVSAIDTTIIIYI